MIALRLTWLAVELVVLKFRLVLGLSTRFALLFGFV